jgi:hypothetical protein
MKNDSSKGEGAQSQSVTAERLARRTSEYAATREALASFADTKTDLTTGITNFKASLAGCPDDSTRLQICEEGFADLVTQGWVHGPSIKMRAGVLVAHIVRSEYLHSSTSTRTPKQKAADISKYVARLLKELGCGSDKTQVSRHIRCGSFILLLHAEKLPLPDEPERLISLLPLRDLDKMVEVWRKLVKEADGGVPTADAVKRYMKANYIPKTRKTSSVEPEPDWSTFWTGVMPLLKNADAEFKAAIERLAKDHHVPILIEAPAPASNPNPAATPEPNLDLNPAPNPGTDPKGTIVVVPDVPPPPPPAEPVASPEPAPTAGGQAAENSKSFGVPDVTVTVNGILIERHGLVILAVVYGYNAPLYYALRDRMKALPDTWKMSTESDPFPHGNPRPAWRHDAIDAVEATKCFVAVRKWAENLHEVEVR